MTLTFCELNSCRLISWSLIKLVLSQIFIFSFHNLSSYICPSKSTVTLMLFSEFPVNVFVLDYFSPEVIVSIFPSQKNMLLSVLDLYVVLIDNWNISRLQMLCTSNNACIFSCRSGLNTCASANNTHAPCISSCFGPAFALNMTCLQPFWFSTPNLLSRTITEADLPWGLVRALQGLCYLSQQGTLDYPSASACDWLSCGQMLETSFFHSLSFVHRGLCLTRS